MEIDSSAKTPSIIKTNIAEVVLKSSIFVKGIAGALIIFYFFSYSEALLNHLCVVPGYVLPPNLWLWTLLTHNFLQSHIVLVLLDICVVILSGNLLEPLWGPVQIGLFFILITSTSALLTSIVYMFVYYVSGNTDYLFETHIYGMSAYIGGFCVAVKQLMPDHILLKLPWGKLRNKHIPLLCLTVVITLSVVKMLNGPCPFQVGFGILASWIYLRFYQKHSNGSKGDMAEEFSFASFFPPPLELPVAIVSNTIFSLLIRMKLCKKPQRKYDVSSPTTITVTLPGTDPADAERRRQLAIKALNERLSKATEETSWPGLDDDEDNNAVELDEVPEVVVKKPAGTAQEPSTSNPQKPPAPTNQQKASNNTLKGNKSESSS